VHEAYLKLLDVNRVRWQDRAHFLALASTAMRRVLVDFARRHRAAKRGGRRTPEPVDSTAASLLDVDNGLSAERADQMLALDRALDKLAAVDPRLSRTVELRFFGGMTVEEAAQVLDLAPSTVKLDWQKAKAWLYSELGA
jgi:RNA polymerase sigma factor (TIGR02999 family)